MKTVFRSRLPLTWIAASVFAYVLFFGVTTHAADLNAEDFQESWAAHGELTDVTQFHPTFASPYSGLNSLQGRHQTAGTTDLSVYFGARLWPHAELWVNSEVDQGFGLSKTQGVAGFPNGEAYKAGANRPYTRLSRAFLRIAEPLGGDATLVASSQMQLSGDTTQDQLVITVGKFSVTDVFDVNTYAHDPRHDFLNWSVIDSGAFDYASDPWGYTYGVSSELSLGRLTARGGLFQLSAQPNGLIHGMNFGNYMAVAEIEERHEWLGAAGKLKFLLFSNHARMGSYRDASNFANLIGGTPDTGLVRQRSSRNGIAVNYEQALTNDLGAFLRVSGNDGSKETYEFTEINRSLAIGLSMSAQEWGRPSDRLGLSLAINAISSEAQRYFAAGGLGLLIGDGKLRYGAEQILEANYAVAPVASLALSLDFQFIKNPAYNQDRGPALVYGLRLHGEF